MRGVSKLTSVEESPYTIMLGCLFSFLLMDMVTKVCHSVARYKSSELAKFSSDSFPAVCFNTAHYHMLSQRSTELQSSRMQKVSHKTQQTCNDTCT